MGRSALIDSNRSLLPVFTFAVLTVKDEYRWLTTIASGRLYKGLIGPWSQVRIPPPPENWLTQAKY